MTKGLKYLNVPATVLASKVRPASRESCAVDGSLALDSRPNFRQVRWGALRLLNKVGVDCRSDHQSLNSSNLLRDNRHRITPRSLMLMEETEQQLSHTLPSPRLSNTSAALARFRQVSLVQCQLYVNDETTWCTKDNTLIEYHSVISRCSTTPSDPVELVIITAASAALAILGS